MNRLIRRLMKELGLLKERVDQLGQWHHGTVTAVGASTCDVRLGQSGDEGTVTLTDVPFIGSAPTVGQEVPVQEWGNGRMEDGAGAFLVHGGGGTGGPGSGGAPTGATYLVTTSDATLTSEVVVGTTPGGELGGTWASPTVDTTHAGSSHLPQADYLVGTAQAGLTSEIVAGTTPQGELGGTWGSPTVDATHSGSAHASFVPLASVSAGVRPYYGPQLRRWYADLENAHTIPANVVVVGDSVAAGANADAPPAGRSGLLGPGRWIETFARRMQQAKGTGRGSVYMPTRSRLLTGTDVVGMNWTHNSTGGSPIVAGSDGGMGRITVDIGASTSNYIQTVQECDAFQIFYIFGLVGGMGDFNVIVDGVTVATVDIPQTGGTWGNVWDSVTAGVNLGPGQHTIRIQTAVTGTVVIEGGIFYNGDYGTGVHVYDAAKGGQQSAYFADTSSGTFGTAGSKMQWIQSVQTVAPSLVIYNMGINDHLNGTSAATLKTNAAYTLDQLKANLTNDPSELVLIPYAQSYNLPPEATEASWLPYRTALFDLATERGAAVMDAYHLLGYANDTDDFADVFSSDQIHPNERGHRALGNLIADYLMGTGPSDRGPTHLTLPAIGDQPDPPSGTGDFHLYPFASRPTPVVRPSGGHPIVAGFPFNKTVVSNQPTTGAAIGWTGAGSADSPALGTVSTQGLTAFTPLATNYTSGTTSGNNAGGGDALTMWWRGAGPLTFNSGFFFVGHVILGSLAAERVFLGFTSGSVASTVASATDPGNHHVGFFYVTGTANWQFSTRDGTTNTKDDTKLAAVATDLHEFSIWCPAASTTIYWQIRNLGAAVGDSTATIPSNKNYKGSKTTNLPGTGTTLRRAWAVQTTEAVAKTLSIARLYCESGR